MRICFIGNTHLTFCASAAAGRRGFIPVPIEEITSAELIIIAQDVKTDGLGNRDVSEITDMMGRTMVIGLTVPIILQSQVPPGFCRPRVMELFFHQPETLRIKDAVERAFHPEVIVVGCDNPEEDLPKNYLTYLDAFGVAVLKMSYESAEFSKIAINMYLASQVDATNRLFEAAMKCGANWGDVSTALSFDKRIGKYLTPGRWQDSIHLLRDSVTLKEIEDAPPIFSEIPF